MIDYAKELLTGGNHSCVLVNGERVLFSDKKGIAPLIDWLKEDKAIFLNAVIADKVIGKAAALLMVFGGVKKVYGVTVSEPSANIFNKYNVCFESGKTVPNIINREGFDICPMEKAVLNIDDPEEAFLVLCDTLDKMKATFA